MKHTPKEIKNRLSNIGEAIGNIALDYITDLENENADLKEEINKIAFARGEVEEENTELGKKVENLQKYLDTRNCYRECAETWLKLTEAKKLLKQFLEAKNGEDTYKAEWEAEQFLKDSKVNK